MLTAMVEICSAKKLLHVAKLAKSQNFAIGELACTKKNMCHHKAVS